VDGNEDTFWHSHWSDGNVPKPPHFLVIDYGEPLNLSGVHYVARADMDNGHVKEYEVYLSNDGQEWGSPAAKGRIPRDAGDQLIQFRNPTSARYLKFVALSEQNNQPFASVAELEAVKAASRTTDEH
jgi:hypothetical protein